jgi:iron(III) transport system substrate-binding protein
MPRARLTHRSIAIVAVVVLAAAAGCGGSAAGAGESITLYNGQHVQTTDALVTAFEEATGIHVNVRSDDEDTLANQIVAEGRNSPADVILTEDSPALEYLQGMGLLARVAPATLAHTPARFNSPQGDWLGVSARVSVLIYNPRLITPADLPTSVMQMAEARYRGKIAIAPGETDFQPIVTSVARTYGDDAAVRWLEGVKANAGDHNYPDNETIASQVDRGSVAFGVVNQYYWYRMRAELGAGNVRSRIAYFAPADPGYVVDVSGVGIVRSSAHKPADQRFLAFMVSERGQEIIAHSQSFEYVIGSGGKMSAAETPLDQLHPNPITIPELGDGATAVGLMRKAGLL